MFETVLWILFVLIIVFAILEKSIKSSVTAEANGIYNRHLEYYLAPSTIKPLLDVKSLEIHNSALKDFQQYFVCNAGIFLFPLHHGIATFSVLHSICFTLSVLAVIICFFFTSVFQAVLYAILSIYFIYISSPAWYPLVGRDDANIERAIANYLRTLTKEKKENYIRSHDIHGEFWKKNEQDRFDMARKFVDREMEQRFHI